MVIQDTQRKNSDWETRKIEVREKNMKELNDAESGKGKWVKIMDIIQSEEESAESEEPKKEKTNKKNNNENNIKEEHEEKKKESSYQNKKAE